MNSPVPVTSRLLVLYIRHIEVNFKFNAKIEEKKSKLTWQNFLIGRKTQVIKSQETLHFRWTLPLIEVISCEILLFLLLNGLKIGPVPEAAGKVELGQKSGIIVGMSTYFTENIIQC